MKFNSTKQRYLALRNRLSRIQGYLDGVTEYSILKNGERYTNNLEKPLFNALEVFYKERASIQYALKAIEEKNQNYMGWLS